MCYKVDQSITHYISFYDIRLASPAGPSWVITGYILSVGINMVKLINQPLLFGEPTANWLASHV